MTLKQCIDFDINKNKQKAWNMIYIRQKRFPKKYYKKHKNARYYILLLSILFQIVFSKYYS